MHRNIKILLTSSIFLRVGINIFAPLYAVYVQHVQGTLKDAGGAIGVFFVLQGLLYLLQRHVPITKKIKHRYMIFAGYSIYALSYFFYIFASMPIHLYFIQALLALGETVVTPSWSAVIAASLSKGKERETYADFFGYRSLTDGLAAVTGGFLVVKFGFVAIFLIMTIAALTAGLLSLLIKEHEFG
jgi:predicted MFS family arabinose efflux permease